MGIAGTARASWRTRGLAALAVAWIGAVSPGGAAAQNAQLAPDELYRRVAPSIYIVIAARSLADIRSKTDIRQGSAVAVTPEIAVTNCHVIEDRRTVFLYFEKQTGAATVESKNEAADICILRSTQIKLKPVENVRGFSDLKVGERVYTIGAPGGLERSLSEGLVSGLREEMPDRKGVKVVQTTAPVSPGSSGGGLFDARGNLIGITTFLSKEFQHLNFAIATNEFWPLPGHPSVAVVPPAPSRPPTPALRTPPAVTNPPSEPMSPGSVFRDCPDCPEMAVIPSGSVTMGSGYWTIYGQQRISVRSFAAGKYEVTFAEWDACVAASGCSHRPDDQGWGRGRQPVMNVSWDDAKQYVAWLSRRTGKEYRPLSEAEWEYAARAGRDGNVGGEAQLKSRNLANCAGCGSRWDDRQTAPVGSFSANGFGLHDMLGNLWEWVEDCWNGKYGGGPTDGRPWLDGDCSQRVQRGGSWDDVPRLTHAGVRGRVITSIRSSSLGFRVARNLDVRAAAPTAPSVPQRQAIGPQPINLKPDALFKCGRVAVRGLPLDADKVKCEEKDDSAADPDATIRVAVLQGILASAFIQVESRRLVGRAFWKPTSADDLKLSAQKWAGGGEKTSGWSNLETTPFRHYRFNAKTDGGDFTCIHGNYSAEENSAGSRHTVWIGYCESGSHRVSDENVATVFKSISVK